VAIESILNTDQLGLPVLTCPFVLTAWMVMMSRSDWLQPITSESCTHVYGCALSLRSWACITPSIGAEPLSSVRLFRYARPSS
jgi:urea transporter